jgi:hypothetical protein
MGSGRDPLRRDNDFGVVVSGRIVFDVAIGTIAQADPRTDNSKHPERTGTSSSEPIKTCSFRLGCPEPASTELSVNPLTLILSEVSPVRGTLNLFTRKSEHVLQLVSEKQ